MREIENANVLHKSNSDYNKNVVDAIKKATRCRNPRDYIDILGGVKDWINIEERTEWEMAKPGNEERNYDSPSNNNIKDNGALVVEEVIDKEEER